MTNFRLQFIEHEASKRYPFQAEPPRMGSYREYPQEGNLDMLTCMFSYISSPQCLGEPQVNKIWVLRHFTFQSTLGRTKKCKPQDVAIESRTFALL